MMNNGSDMEITQEEILKEFKNIKKGKWAGSGVINGEL